MAQVLFCSLFQEKMPGESQQWQIESAGTWTEEGLPPSKGANEALNQLFGLNLNSHHSRQLTTELMDQFNLILVMEYGHKEALQIEFPNRASRVFLLSEMVGAKYEIEDPFGGEFADFAGDPRAEQRSVETLDHAHAAIALDDARPKFFHAAPQRGHRTETCYDDAPFHVLDIGCWRVNECD